MYIKNYIFMYYFLLIIHHFLLSSYGDCKTVNFGLLISFYILWSDVLIKLNPYALPLIFNNEWLTILMLGELKI